MSSARTKHTSGRRPLAVLAATAVFTALAVTPVTPPGLTSAARAATSPAKPPAAVDPTPYIQASAAPGPTTVSGDITTDTVWGPQGSPYLITSRVRVMASAALTMLPGTVVKIGGQMTSLVVMPGGQLLALGSPSSHVIITSINDDTAGGVSNADTAPASPGDWGHIDIEGTSAGDPASSTLAPASVIDYAEISYGGYDSDPAAGEIRTSYATHFVLSNSVLRDSYNTGYSDVGSSSAAETVGIYNNEFLRDGSDIQAFDSDAQIVGNTLRATTRADSSPQMRGAAAYISYPYRVRFWYNTAYSWVTVNGGPDQPTRAQADVQYNTFAGNAGGWYPAYQDLKDWDHNWWSSNANHPVDQCWTQSGANAQIPQVLTAYDPTCPAGTYRGVRYGPAVVLPALSSPVRGISAAAIAAAEPHFGPVNTYTGALTYQASDLAVADAGGQLAATRIYRSDNLGTNEAGAGWTESYDEALTASTSGSTANFSDGSSVDFATDPAAGTLRDAGTSADLVHNPTDQSDTLRTADGTGFRFDATGALTGLTLGDDAHQVNVGHDQTGRVSHVTGVSGRRLDFNRTAGQLTSITDNTGRSVNLSYAGAQLAAATGVDGNTEKYTYDLDGHLTSVTAPSGTVKLQAGYQDDGRAAWIDLPGTGRSTFAYDTAHHQTTITAADGTVTQQQYDSYGRLVTERVGATGTHTVYDGDGRTVSVITGIPDGPMTGYSPAAPVSFHDEHGNPIAEVDPVGIVTYTTFNARHRPLVTTFSDGTTLTRNYDDSNRLASVTDQLGRVTRYAHDALGQITAVTDPLGRTRTYTYTANGDPASSTDAFGATTALATDDLGRIVSSTDPAGHVTTTTYTSWSVPATVTASGTATRYGYDTDRRQVSLTDALGAVSTVRYDGQGRVAATVDPLGRTTKDGYDQDGRLVDVTGAGGGVTHLTYTPEGWIATVTDPTGRTRTFAYDPAGRVVRSTDPSGNTQQTRYNRDGQSTDVWTADGAHSVTTYDMLGRAASSTDSLGNMTRYAYDAAGEQIAQTDAAGDVVRRSYDGAGRITGITDALGNTTSYTYDDAHRTTTVADASGVLRTVRVNALGQPDSLTDPTGGSTTLTYDAAGHLTDVQTPSGTAHDVYDAAGRVTASTDASGVRTTFGYDAAGQLTSTSRAGATETYAYDAAGNVVTRTDPTGGAWTYTYDPANRMLSQSDPLGHRSAYTYDEDGRLSSTTDPTGVTTNTAYDPVGRPAVTSDQSGASWVTRYDLAGNVTSTTDPDGVTKSYTYTNLNQVSMLRNGSGYGWFYTYDADGRLAAANEGITTKYTYDNRGRLTTVTDGVGDQTRYGYDEAGRTTSVTAPSGAVTTRSYDSAGNLTKVTDPLGAATSYTYGPGGRLDSMTLPAGGTYAYGYDAAGRLAWQSDPDQQRTSFTYNQADQATEVHLPSGSTLDTSYDAAGRQTSTSAGSQTRTFTYDAAGRITGVTGTGSAPLSFTYDNRGLPSSSTDALGTTQYTFTDGGRLASHTGAGGATATYTYNDQGLLATVRGTVNFNYTYNSAGQVTGRSPVSPTRGWGESRGYDAAGRLTAINGWYSAAYAYTSDGRTSTVSEPNAYYPTRQVSYGYDAAGRLTDSAVTQNGATTARGTYRYDADGNRTSAAVSGGTAVTSTYDPADRMLASSDGTTYGYDADGHLVQQGSTTLTYNAFGELVGTSAPGAAPVSYGRDPLGRLASASTGTSTTQFSYDGMSSDLAGGRSPSGQVTDLVRDPAGLLLAEAPSGGAPLSAAVNAHGDLMGLVDGGTYSAAWTGTYDPFGNVTSTTGTAPLPLGYQSQYQDRTTGLVDMGARMYDPSTGRFGTQDNVVGDTTNPGSLNRYAYAFGDPVDLADPNGHMPNLLNQALGAVGSAVSGILSSGWNALGDVAGAAADQASPAVRSVASRGAAALGQLGDGVSAQLPLTPRMGAAVVAQGVVGLGAYVGCTALTRGVGSALCGAAAGAASGAVFASITCPQDSNLASCVVAGAVAGGLSGGAASSLEALGMPAVVIGGGAALTGDAAGQLVQTGRIDPGELVLATATGGVLGLGSRLLGKGVSARAVGEDEQPAEFGPAPADAVHPISGASLADDHLGLYVPALVGAGRTGVDDILAAMSAYSEEHARHADHMKRTSILMSMLGEPDLAQDPDMLIAMAAHDGGKGMLPESLLTKPKPNDDEFRQLGTHSGEMALDFVKSRFPHAFTGSAQDRVTQFILHHHTKNPDLIDEALVHAMFFDSLDAIAGQRSYAKGPMEPERLFDMLGSGGSTQVIQAAGPDKWAVYEGLLQRTVAQWDAVETRLGPLKWGPPAP